MLPHPCYAVFKIPSFDVTPAPAARLSALGIIWYLIHMRRRKEGRREGGKEGSAERKREERDEICISFGRSVGWRAAAAAEHVFQFKTFH